ncbi:hypothetical protein [Demequina sp.]|uniref:hypothetical protein n=1 Tax=Demequina sp. TaxID=2050685 RepID=UPI003A86E418
MGTGSTNDDAMANGHDADALEDTVVLSPIIDSSRAVSPSAASFPSPPSVASVSGAGHAPVAPSAASAPDPIDDLDDLDDGTPESDADPESDASDLDEVDNLEVGAAGTLVPVTVGAVRDDGDLHRRRRHDPPPEVFDYAVAARRGREPRQSGGRRGWIAASVLLFLMLGLSVALNWHLWTTAEAWEARSDELTDINYDLGDQLATEQSAGLQLESEIDLLSQQLATSNQTVIDLSAEKADALDATEYASQQIDTVTGHLTTATSVATSLQRCVDGQEQLIEYLGAPDNYDPVELAAFQKSVDELCTRAENANQRMRSELAE